MRFDGRLPQDLREKRQVVKDPMIRALLTKAPEEIDAYIQNQVSDLQSAKQVLSVLARVVSVLARREIEEGGV